MIEHWVKRQDTLLRLYNESFPGQLYWSWPYILERLNECQRRIDYLKRTKT